MTRVELVYGIHLNAIGINFDIDSIASLSLSNLNNRPFNHLSCRKKFQSKNPTKRKFK